MNFINSTTVSFVDAQSYEYKYYSSNRWWNEIIFLAVCSINRKNLSINKSFKYDYRVGGSVGGGFNKAHLELALKN